MPSADDYDWPEEILNIWVELEHAVTDPDRVADWVDQAESLFHTGWVESDIDHEERLEAREAFFALMEEFDISEEHFDWDAWRDWYANA